MTIREQRSAAARSRLERSPDHGIVHLVLEHDRPAHHDRQRVVQLMRHAGQQRAERSQALTQVRRLALAPDLGLRLLAFGNVAADRLDLDQLSLLVEDPGVGPLLMPQTTAVRFVILIGHARVVRGKVGP